MNPKVDFYFEKESPWQQSFQQLRSILLATGLEETLKWGHPCYTYQQKNIVLMHGFKNYCALLFFKGALLQDPDRVLVQQTAQVQATRQLRFPKGSLPKKIERAIKTLVYEAIEVEKTGLKVPAKKTADYPVPEEWTVARKKNKALAKAFDALTPGRQRGYLLHFAAAKQAKTREARIQKYIPAILRGKGMDDQF